MEKNERNESLKSIAALADEYYTTASRLEARIAELKKQMSAHPAPDELNSLRRRRELLMTERRELIYTACELSRLAAPKPPTPSLARRQSQDASARRCGL